LIAVNKENLIFTVSICKVFVFIIFRDNNDVFARDSDQREMDFGSVVMGEPASGGGPGP